jgi:tripartite-type tricarboxylate transporter receptor subunit TctC
VHVPYRGAAPAVADLVAGQVQVYFDPIPNSIGYIRAGKVRPLAITSATRSEALPDVPTISEFVPGYEGSFWFGVGAPKATPAAIVDKLNNGINAALADPKIKARLADLGGTVVNTPACRTHLVGARQVDRGRHVGAERALQSRISSAAGPTNAGGFSLA